MSSITIQNEAHEGAKVYRILPLDPLVEGGELLVFHGPWYETLEFGAEFTFDFDPRVFIFLGWCQGTGQDGDPYEVNVKAFNPVQVGGVSNNRCRFYVTRSKKLREEIADSLAPDSTVQVIVDHLFYGSHIFGARGAWVVGLAKMQLCDSGQDSKIHPVCGVFIIPGQTYTFKPNPSFDLLVRGADNIFQTSKMTQSWPNGQLTVTDYGRDRLESVLGPKSQPLFGQEMESRRIGSTSPSTSPEMTGSSTGGPTARNSQPGLLSSTAAADQAAADSWKYRFQQLVGEHRLWTIPSEEQLRVAVLDSGIDLDHQDLAEKEGRIAAKKSFVKTTVQDTDGHGTHIAGLILELTENVVLYVGKITESSATIHEHESDIATALEHAREEWKVDIISLSFGFTKPLHSIQRQIDKCIAKGIAIFAAASNDGGNAPRTYPASYNPPIMCIYSATADGNKSPKNPTPLPKKDNFMVLGECVKSSWPLGKGADEEGKRYMSGTSFATPVAVSIAALMLGYIYKNVPAPDQGWIIRPKSPDGVRALFKLLAQRVDRDGYDLISPMWFFERFPLGKIKEDITDTLNSLE